jgi:hypothetical protein
LIGWWIGRAVEEGGFERRDAVDAPRSVGEFLGDLGLGGSSRFEFVEEAAAMASCAAWSSEGRTAEAAVKPWRSAFCDERCLPESVRGPVECRELARLMAARSTGVRWADVIGVADIIGVDIVGPRNRDNTRVGRRRGGIDLGC